MSPHRLLAEFFRLPPGEWQEGMALSILVAMGGPRAAPVIRTWLDKCPDYAPAVVLDWESEEGPGQERALGLRRKALLLLAEKNS